MLKIAVYTAIFGDKDSIREPINYNGVDSVDYFLITDKEDVKNHFYKIIYSRNKFTDIAKNARYYKLIGLKEFKKYDYIIWHDANLQLLHNSIPSLIKSVQHKQLATFQHPKRTNFYDEAIACILDEKEDSFTVFYQCLCYFFKNISPHCGLYETSILVKNNRRRDDRFYKTWWEEIKRHSRRDQISLPYALGKHKIQIGILKGERLDSPYVIYHEHNYDEYLNSEKKVVMKLLSNDLVIKWINNLKRLSRRIHKKRTKA